MNRASGVSKEDAGRFRRTVMNIAQYGVIITLFVYAYWLNGRKAAPSFVEHVKRLYQAADMRSHGLALEGFDFRADYPELYRYAYIDDTSEGEEPRALERKAAGMFYDGFLSHPEYPAGEGWVYVRFLTRWAYLTGALNRLEALTNDHKLFIKGIDGFWPIITMDYKPDYSTVRKWSAGALRSLNLEVLDEEDYKVVQSVYDRERFTKWYPMFEQAGVHPDEPVKTTDAVRLVLLMAEQGMKDGVRVFRDYLAGPEMKSTKQVRNPRYRELETVEWDAIPPERPIPGLSARRVSMIRHALIKEKEIFGSTTPLFVASFFTPVDGGDPVQAYDDYLKRRRDGQA
ncbi:hypothetical protein [Bifidobacterium thermacidophilum]|uniref:Uncharacterized protein n=1 Tax=Bifidobacterium thermacidophilum subsp. thermacidophilum TaxID=79262 RepID=A0A087EAR6_9BIFI|nr:hypothetical protein [Bifidobacterium thermacidophilum]KFJ04867.1 hypothetical protein THER5_1673 [Bifidobacterium thermacidophilum subsp. thermacidophilum]